MTELLLSHEPTIRLAAAASVFALLALWEIVGPRRELVQPKGQRWLWNLSVVVFNTLMLRLLVPTATMGAAIYAQQHGWGLLNLVALPELAAVAIAVVLLDGLIYAQHLVFHLVPPLWRIHRMHHADVDLDVTSGTRFHPIEMLLSMGIKLAAVMALGAPAVAVFVFELVLNLMAMFNHSNIQIPVYVDRWLRWLIVTPDMHRVHHSDIPAEHNQNFGFNLAVWDHIFGTYTAHPSLGQRDMVLGLPNRDPSKTQTLWWLLAVPFRR